MSPSPVRLAVDIGGTFTDVVLMGAADRPLVTAKRLTTGDPLIAVEEGITVVLEQAGVSVEELCEPIVHATTLVTNALIENRAASVAFVTTGGFEDTLAIRTEHRYAIYDVQIEFPRQPTPREMIFGVGERTLADGDIWQAPDLDDVERIAAEINASDAESIAVGFLHSYANPENERGVAQRLRELTDLPISISSEVAGQVREYPRFVTTVANAATVPILGPYLDRLQARLRELRIPAAVLLMLSNGGAVSADVAATHPIRAIESGPAAGALAGGWFANIHALPSLLCFDMGGTTAKACILTGGEPQIGTSFEYDRQYRFVAGSGLPLTTASVDLIEIGAGGGSIARRDALGLLAVGPQSAGSEPGPACYGRGGDQPTVTDADLLLGYFDPEAFAGGSMPLDVGAAQTAVDRLAAELETDAEQLPIGIHELANQNMAAATARYASERAIEVRGVPLLAFGGAGPVHACAVAELLGASEVIYPPLASVLSAFGCLASPLRMDLARTRLSSLDGEDPDRLDDVYRELRAQCLKMLADSGLDPAHVDFRYAVDMRYVGQANELTVWVDSGDRFTVTPDELRASFEARYTATYGMSIPGVGVEAVTWRITATGPDPSIPTYPTESGSPAPPTGTRPARFALNQPPVETAIYRRASLVVGQELNGPAVIEEPDTTIVLRPGWQARVAADGSVVAKRGIGVIEKEMEVSANA